MIACPRDVLRDFAGMVAPSFGAKVVRRAGTQLSGNSRDGGHSSAEVFEWVGPSGEVVARKVSALGQVETWLRADLCTEVLIARSDEVAERERIIREVAAYAQATRGAQGQREQSYILSTGLLHAAVRRNARLGRLYDMDSRGDKVRGNLAHALDRAVKAEGSAK